MRAVFTFLCCLFGWQLVVGQPCVPYPANIVEAQSSDDLNDKIESGEQFIVYNKDRSLMGGIHLEKSLENQTVLIYSDFFELDRYMETISNSTLIVYCNRFNLYSEDIKIINNSKVFIHDVEDNRLGSNMGVSSPFAFEHFVFYLHSNSQLGIFSKDELDVLSSGLVGKSASTNDHDSHNPFDYSRFVIKSKDLNILDGRFYRRSRSAIYVSSYQKIYFNGLSSISPWIDIFPEMGESFITQETLAPSEYGLGHRHSNVSLNAERQIFRSWISDAVHIGKLIAKPDPESIAGAAAAVGKFVVGSLHDMKVTEAGFINEPEKEHCASLGDDYYAPDQLYQFFPDHQPYGCDQISMQELFEDGARTFCQIVDYCTSIGVPEVVDYINGWDPDNCTATTCDLDGIYETIDNGKNLCNLVGGCEGSINGCLPKDTSGNIICQDFAPFDDDVINSLDPTDYDNICKFRRISARRHGYDPNDPSSTESHLVILDVKINALLNINVNWKDYCQILPLTCESSSTNNARSSFEQEDLEWQKTIVYPNPSEGNITVRLSSTEALPSLMEIVDLSGKVVFRSKIDEPSHALQFDISTLSPGQYVVVLSGNSVFISEKLLIE